MSWQHLNQPQGWIGVISLSLSLSPMGIGLSFQPELTAWQHARAHTHQRTNTRALTDKRTHTPINTDTCQHTHRNIHTACASRAHGKARTYEHKAPQRPCGPPARQETDTHTHTERVSWLLSAGLHGSTGIQCTINSRCDASVMYCMLLAGHCHTGKYTTGAEARHVVHSATAL